MTRSLLVLMLLISQTAPVVCQSRATRGPGGSLAFGAIVKFTVFQFDGAKSQALQDVTHLQESFATAGEEAAYLRENQNLEEVAVRHERSVGLTDGETFNDAIHSESAYMYFAVTPSAVQRGQLKLDMKVTFGDKLLLDAKGIEIGNFETVLLKGGTAMFGLKRYIGPGGKQESAPVERTLMISVTPQIVAASNLRDRPRDLSHPVDDVGAELQLQDGDKFTPPVVIERVSPSYDTGHPISGSVKVDAIITKEGKIMNVQIVQSLDSAFDQRAVDAFRRYQFSPALLNGKPVGATFHETLTFTGGQVPEEKPKPKKKSRFPRPFPLD